MENNVISGGGSTPRITHLKACYAQGEWCSKNDKGAYDHSYVPLPIQITIGKNKADLTYLNVEVIRTNSHGHGVFSRSKATLILGINYGEKKITIYSAKSNISFDNIQFLWQIISNSLLDIDLITYEVRSSGAFLTNTKTIQLTGVDGYLYQEGYNAIIPTAYEKAIAVYAGEEYEYNPLWANGDMWWRGMLIARVKADGAISDISGAAYYRMAQKGIVDLILHKLQRGEDYTTITWWQMQYYVVNTKNKTSGVDEYVDSATAEAWVRENMPAVTARYEAALPQEGGEVE